MVKQLDYQGECPHCWAKQLDEFCPAHQEKQHWRVRLKECDLLKRLDGAARYPSGAFSRRIEPR